MIKNTIFLRDMISVFILSLTMTACAPKAETDDTDLTLMVNPMIGTDFTGNTYPGAQAPFGMVQLSPDNGLPGWDRISGYFYPDSTIAGFSHTQEWPYRCISPECWRCRSPPSQAR